MEGNLSLKEAAAAVSCADEKPEEQPQEDGAWHASTKRRKRLLRSSFFLTGLWLGLCGVGMAWAYQAGQLSLITPAHIGVFIAATFAPLCLIWTITLVLQRSDPLLERRLAIARTLQSTIAPVDAAEAKLDRMLERLRKDVMTVDQTVLLASERISALEERFKEQVSQLFSATTDAEAKSASIREQLRRERESMEGLRELLDGHLISIRDTMAKATDETIQSEMKSRDAFQSAAQSFETQYSQLIKASDKTVEGISTVMNGLAERTTALDAAALAATQKLGKGVSALKAHEDDYRGFINQFSDDFKAFDGGIDARLVALEAAQNRLEKTNEHLFTDLQELGDRTDTAVDGALEKTRNAVTALEVHQGAVEETTAAMLSALDDQQIEAQGKLHTLSSELEAVQEKLAKSLSAALAEQKTAGESFQTVLNAHTHSWESALQKFSQILTHDTERAGSIAANRIGQAQDDLKQAVVALHEEAEAVMTEKTSQLRSLAKEIDDKSTSFSAAGADQIDAMKGQIEALEAQRAAVADAITAFGLSTSDMRLQTDGQIESLSETLSAAEATLTHKLRQIQDAIQNMSGLPEQLEATWSPQLSALDATLSQTLKANESALSTLSEQSEKVRNETLSMIETMEAKLQQLGTVADENIGKLEPTADKLSTLQTAFADLQYELQQSDVKLDDIIRGLQTVRSVAREVTTFDDEAIATMSAQLETQIDDLKKQSDELKRKATADQAAILSTYEDAMDAAEALSSNVSSKLADTTKQVTQEADKAIDLARLKWTGLSEERQTAARDALESMITGLTAAFTAKTDEITQHLTGFQETTQISLDRLAADTSERLTNSEQTLGRVKSLTKQLDEKTSTDLIKASSLIIDALNSSAIDINKALSVGHNDEEWARYLAGDKSFFTRKTAQALTKSERENLRKKLNTDEELRQSVLHYIKDFELLMSRAMTGKQPTSLSVALISSDIGKLYVALSQALRRLN